jgi:PKD repeat protein
MNSITRVARAWHVAAALVLAIPGFAGCGLDRPTAPALTGPSEFGLSVTLTATPDQIARDGRSVSTINVLVRDADNRPVSGQRLSVGSSLGTVSQSEIVTGPDGRATFSFQAPSSGTVGDAVIEVLPIGTNADNAVARSISVILTPGNRSAPSPSFTFSPTAPERLQLVTFDASGTTDDGVRCGDACTYSWDFGGEATATGRIVTYQFRQVRTYPVRLTVTDGLGASASLTQTVTVGETTPPSPSFTVSPSPPAVLQNAIFDASASAAAAGHTITSFSWNFGDGSTESTTSPRITHVFLSSGPLVVTLTAQDETGRQATFTQNVVVSGVTFTASPTNPQVGDTVTFNASGWAATATTSISKYEWDFGDGNTADTGSTPTSSHRYTSARTFTVRVTATDSQGRRVTGSNNITVAEQD